MLFFDMLGFVLMGWLGFGALGILIPVLGLLLEPFFAPFILLIALGRWIDRAVGRRVSLAAAVLSPIVVIGWLYGWSGFWAMCLIYLTVAGLVLRDRQVEP